MGAMNDDELKERIRVALRRAAEKVGGQTKLAHAIGSTQGHVSQWICRGKVPAEKVAKIEKVTGIPRAELRPDVFGDAA